MRLVAGIIAALLVLLATPAAAHQASPEPRKVIIDADPGIDDSVAILFALHSPALEVLGITTVFGNADIEQATRNALTLVELAGRRLPVARGASKPWIGDPSPPPDFVHGADGLGNVETPLPATGPIDMSAAQFIVETVRAHPGEVTLLAIGRLTNLAAALAIEPRLPALVREVIVMGGAASVRGNVSPVAEANVHGDPHAADIVFTTRWPITMVGLDVTTQVRLQDSVLERIGAANQQAGGFIYEITRFYRGFYDSIGLTGGFYVHDPSAVAFLIDREIFSTEKARVRVATDGIAAGQTIVVAGTPSEGWTDWADLPEVDVCRGVDADRLLRLLESTLTR